MRSSFGRVRPFLRAIVALTLGGPAGAQYCEGREPRFGPSRDLYCIELIAAALPGVRARVELGHLDGPFTISVTASGSLRYRPTMVIAGLPRPSSLGAFTTYVAWVATPVMHPIRRLGVVTNGRVVLPTIDLDKFIVLVTAEATSGGTEPNGRIVLRGASPSTRLQPPDIMQFALGAVADSGATTHVHGAAHDTVSQSAGSVRWTTVPMPSVLQMLPAEMALRPDVAPYLPRASHGRPAAPVRPRELVRLRSGDTLRLTAGLVTRPFKGRTFTMYGFNGQHPGPLLQVSQGAVVTVEFTNALDQPSSVHWHGIRLENRFDGVPHLTQDAVPPGGHFTYRLRFPDAGIYWYHPHVREDIQQDLGLAGNLLVRSPHADHYSPADREEVLMLDDLLVGDDGLVPFGRESPTHALMGRFGNVYLVNGEPSYRLDVPKGSVVRLLLTNVSNTRTLNLSFPGARMKVVAGDVSNYEREAWVESVVIAPAERYVVHVRFDRPGRTPLVNRVQALDHLFGRFFYEADTLGVVAVRDVAGSPRSTAGFAALRPDARVRRDVARARAGRLSSPRTLVLTMTARDLPFLTRQLMQLDSVFFAPVEWSGTMPSMNWASTGSQVRWIVRDPATGRENMDIDWRFRRGELVPLRLVNERESFHAMQHPIHLHGQRFLVLAVNGTPTTNRVWKDTVLVPAGSAIDLLVEMSNPGRWMLHCHIAEHLSADMMMAFVVE